MPGTHFRAPLSVKLLDGSSVEIVDATGVVVAALGDGGSVTQDTLVATNKKLEFRAAANYINSPAAGKLEIVGSAGGADDVKLTGGITLNGDIAIADGKQLKPDGSTASATAGAATLSKQSGVVTSESLTTAAGATYTLTLTNTLIAATSIVLASIQNGDNSAGDPALGLITPGSGSATIKVVNRHASAALNGTLKISFLVLNPQ